ncbi:hypothetical protein BVRB_7g165770 [Beta vulgaris subsp. vulgaris]|nr:hypothetical protein BVRB_7g165770 [Beta vulgaris subsp. vulgaris]
MPKKCNDLGMFTIPITLGDTKIEKVMLYLGASINVLPYSLYESVELGELLPTNVVIQLADRSTSIPRGVLKDVLVEVDKMTFPADFDVINMEHNRHSTPILLGRLFLKTANARIGCGTGSLTMQFDGQNVEFKMHDAMGSKEDHSIYSIDVVNPSVHDVFDVSSGGEKISSIRHPGLRIAAYFLGMTIFCKGETGKLNQLEMCYLRALLPGSVGIPDWVDLWLKSCIDVRAKLGGHLSMGRMITHLITRLGYAPNNACDPEHFSFGPTVSDFFIRPEVGGGILDEMDEDDEGDGDYVMEMEQGEGSRLSSIEEQLQGLTLQGNATMGYVRHLDAFFQQQYGGSYVP